MNVIEVYKLKLTYSLIIVKKKWIFNTQISSNHPPYDLTKFVY